MFKKKIKIWICFIYKIKPTWSSYNNDGFESADWASQFPVRDAGCASCRTDWNTHPKVEEDTKAGERPKEAAGQCSQQLWLSLGCGWHHLPVPFSAGRKELYCNTVKMQWRRQNGRNTQHQTNTRRVWLWLFYLSANTLAVYQLSWV